MKSHASEQLLELIANVYKDACDKCDALQPQERDLLTMRSRVEREGLSFLTITLPTLGQDLEKALDQGFIGSNQFRSFRKRSKVPAFLQGFFSLIFDIRSGRLYEYSRISICAIAGIRQLAYVFKKLRISCTAERQRRAINEYKCSESVFDVQVTRERQDYYNHVCDVLWPGVIGGINPLDTVPKHGPGATAERIRSNRKYSAQHWHDRLESYFPLLSCAFHNESAVDSEEFKAVTIVERAQEQPVRVILVPKTLKTPRVIAIEPVCMQYTQQAISEALVRALETSELTAGHINFTDQSVNQALALRASSDLGLATLDLSSASDRVPRDLALRMFQFNPDLMDAIDACRSASAKTPDGEVIHLKKFASMGSALCFPVESMYFYTLCIGALLEFYKLPVTFLNVRQVRRKVYVYGDDLIIPTDSASYVAGFLQEYYCKVNIDKSFWNGSFRESCGMDAFRGERVTPVYVRENVPRNKREAKSLISWVETGNLFYKEGYWYTAAYIKKLCERILGKLPIVQETSSALGWYSFQKWHSTDRWNKALHRSEVRAWVVTPVYEKDPIDGLPALLKCLLSMQRREPIVGQPISVDAEHLQRSARHGVATLKRRWAVPY